MDNVHLHQPLVNPVPRFRIPGNQRLIAGAVSIVLHCFAGAFISMHETASDGDMGKVQDAPRAPVTVYLVMAGGQVPASSEKAAKKTAASSTPAARATPASPEAMPVHASLPDVPVESTEPFESTLPARATGDIYYRSDELSSVPQVTVPPHNILPENDDAKIIGSVRLRILISETGAIDSVLIEQSTLPDEYVDHIREAWSRAAYSPGKIEDVAVKSQVVIEIRLTHEMWRPIR